MALSIIESLAWVSTILLPLFNIPLILKMIQRRSSEDISLIWVSGVFLCLLGMLPQALISSDVIFRWFGILNCVLYAGVFLTAYYFRFFKRGNL